MELCLFLVQSFTLQQTAKVWWTVNFASDPLWISSPLAWYFSLWSATTEATMVSHVCRSCKTWTHVRPMSSFHQPNVIKLEQLLKCPPLTRYGLMAASVYQFQFCVRATYPSRTPFNLRRPLVWAQPQSPRQLYSRCILKRKVCHVSNQRQTNLYAAVKNSTLQSKTTKTQSCPFCWE